MDIYSPKNNNTEELIQTKEIYRVIVVGPTGMGKSQFCNFVQKDTSNSINKVSDSLNSCTQDPFSNNFKRNNANYEFIDTAGNADSGNNDIQNLKKLVEYLKKKQSIDYILLLLKFGERVTNDTRDYIKTLGKIFTPSEFYNHLSVIFTKFPIKPTKKEEKIKNQSKEEINIIIKNSFNIDINEATPQVKVYFIDTEYDEDENTYDEKSQATIDIMMEQIKLNVFNYDSIDTRNLDMVGDSAKCRLEAQKKQIEQLKEMIEQEKQNKIKEEKEKEILQNELKKAKLDEETRKKKEKEIQELIEQQKIRERKLREIEECNRRIADENRRKQELIELEAKRRGIVIEELDNKIDTCKKISKGSLFSFLGGIALSGGLLALDCFCPALIPATGPALTAIQSAFFGGGLVALGSGITWGASKSIGYSTKKKKDQL